VILIHQRHRQTDRQTDRRTDRRTTCNLNTALCTSASRGKNLKILFRNTKFSAPSITDRRRGLRQWLRRRESHHVVPRPYGLRGTAAATGVGTRDSRLARINRASLLAATKRPDRATTLQAGGRRGHGISAHSVVGRIAINWRRRRRTTTAAPCSPAR